MENLLETTTGKARAICILGMHRSGTSTVARTINLLGAYLGEDEKMMPPSRNNPEGYWEHLDIFNLHVRLLQQLGRTWGTALPLPERWFQSETIRPFRDELEKLVAANFAGHSLWAWKEPRTCLFLPLWREVFNKMETPLCCLFVVRNPVDVASSVHHRDFFPFNRAVGIWFHYSVVALKDAAGLPIVFLNYDRLIESWEPELRRCATALGLEGRLDEPGTREAINAFIKPGLRHYQSEPGRLQQLPQPVRELYQILYEASTEPSFDMRRHEATINRLSEKFHAGSLESLSVPKVSVLVPVFNGEKYLAECLDSILMQDFSDYELLISDDCSTDGTAEIIKNYAAKDPRIRWWRNPVNLKQAANLNLCLRESRGQYIKFVFADDKLLTPTALHQMVQILDDDPSVVLVSSASHVITASSQLIQVRDPFTERLKWLGEEILLRCLEDPATLDPVNLIGEPTLTMFRREQAARGFDEQFRSLLDLELWFHLLEQGKFACIAEPLSAFRRHGAQETLINRRSGASVSDGFRLQKIYFPRMYQRQLVTRLRLFHQLRRLRKIPATEAVALADALKQSLGWGWRAFYSLRYRLRRLSEDLKFWRSRSRLAGGPLPAQWDPAPPVPGRSDHPLVSVLVPVYNGEKYLAECLDSILMQDFHDMEILIADDGSTDGSRELIQRYAAKDPRIRWWRNPANLGLAANFNACLHQARGKYIKFVLQDDKLLSSLSLLKMASILENHPTIALVSSTSHVITADSRLIQVRDYFKETRWWAGEEILLRCLEDPATLDPVNLIGEPTLTMFRREQAARGFDEQFRQLLDLELWFHLLEQGKFACIAEPLSAFRRHGAQETLINRRSGASVSDGFRLQKIYFPRMYQRQLVTRLRLFHQLRRLRKIPATEAVALADALKQSLGWGWCAFYSLRYRLRRLSEDLKFWRSRSRLAGGPLPAQWDPAPPVPGRSDHPLVSVLVPVYNGEKYLAECLDSILMQDFHDMEILIADDGSTDGSRELIQRYAAKDPRIRWWRNPANLGLAANFNACLHQARNDYIKYVLQDDVLVSPSAIRLMVQALDADPAVSLAGSASYVIDGQSQRLELRNAFSQSGVMDGKAAILECLTRNGNLIGEPSVVMFRREQAGRGYDERYKQLIDLDFWFHLLEQGRFAYLAEPLCAFRQHREQQTVVNRESGAHVQDELMLAQYWLSRPWLREAAGRRVLFNQIYNLRKHHGERARPFIGDIMASLTVKWYVLYWLEHKISSPFRNLRRWIYKRLIPRPQTPAAGRG